MWRERERAKRGRASTRRLTSGAMYPSAIEDEGKGPGLMDSDLGVETVFFSLPSNMAVGAEVAGSTLMMACPW